MKLIRIEEQIKMIIAEYATFLPDEISYDDKLTDLGIDALKFAKLIARVEKVFSVVLDKSKLNPSITVCVFVELIENHIPRINSD